MDRIDELKAGFRRMQKPSIIGNRTRHVITFNPNKAKPGEEVYINIPKLNLDLCLVPDSIYLCFDFKNSNAKSWFKNKLSKLLQKYLDKLFMKTREKLFTEFTAIFG